MALIQYLSYHGLQKAFAKITNTALIRIEELGTNVIKSVFIAVKDVKAWDLQRFFFGIIKNFTPIFKMLLPVYTKKLYRFMFHGMCRSYLLMIITLSTQYSPKEKNRLITRLRKDRKLIKLIFDGKVNAKDIEEKYQQIKQYDNCLYCKPDDLIIEIIRLEEMLEEDFKEEYIVNCL